MRTELPVGIRRDHQIRGEVAGSHTQVRLPQHVPAYARLAYASTACMKRSSQHMEAHASIYWVLVSESLGVLANTEMRALLRRLNS